MFDAVIFDLDGTLIDSEAVTQAAGIEAFASLGVAVDPAFLHGLIGIDDQTGAGIIRARFPDLDPDAFATAWTREVRDPLPGRRAAEAGHAKNCWRRSLCPRRSPPPPRGARPTPSWR